MTETTTTRWDELTEAGKQAAARGDLARADESYRAALAEAEQRWPESAKVAGTLASLGQLRYQARDYNAAEVTFRRALALRERLLGADHPGVAQTLNNLAAVHVARGAHDAAEPLLLRALGITERHRGPDHPDVAVNLNNLAKLYFKRNEHARAEPLLTRLLELKRAADPAHPDVAAVLASLAQVELAHGAPNAAERLLREAIDIRTRAGVAEDAALAGLRETLADACMAQGSLLEALAERERVVRLRERILGATHATTVAARERLDALRARLDGPRRGTPASLSRVTPSRVPAAPATPAALPTTSSKPATPAAPARAATTAASPDELPPLLAAAKRISGLQLMSIPDDAAEPPTPAVAAPSDAYPTPAPFRRSGALPLNPWLTESEPPSVLAAETGEHPVAQADAPVPPPFVPPPLDVPAPPARRASGAFEDSWGRESGEAAASQPALPAAPLVTTGLMTPSLVAPMPVAPVPVAPPAAPPVSQPPAPRTSGARRAPEPEVVADRAPRAPRKPRMQPDGAPSRGGGSRFLVAATLVIAIGGGAWFTLGRGLASRAEAAPDVASELAGETAAPDVPGSASASVAPVISSPVESSPVPAAAAPKPAPVAQAADTATLPPPPRLRTPLAPPVPMISTDLLTRGIDSAARVDLRPRVAAPTFGNRPPR